MVGSFFSKRKQKLKCLSSNHFDEADMAGIAKCHLLLASPCNDCDKSLSNSSIYEESNMAIRQTMDENSTNQNTKKRKMESTTDALSRKKRKCLPSFHRTDDDYDSLSSEFSCDFNHSHTAATKTPSTAPTNESHSTPTDSSVTLRGLGGVCCSQGLTLSNNT